MKPVLQQFLVVHVIVNSGVSATFLGGGLKQRHSPLLVVCTASIYGPVMTRPISIRQVWESVVILYGVFRIGDSVSQEQSIILIPLIKKCYYAILSKLSFSFRKYFLQARSGISLSLQPKSAI